MSMKNEESHMLHFDENNKMSNTFRKKDRPSHQSHICKQQIGQIAFTLFFLPDFHVKRLCGPGCSQRQQDCKASGCGSSSASEFVSLKPADVSKEPSEQFLAMFVATKFSMVSLPILCSVWQPKQSFPNQVVCVPEPILCKLNPPEMLTI